MKSAVTSELIVVVSCNSFSANSIKISLKARELSRFAVEKRTKYGVNKLASHPAKCIVAVPPVEMISLIKTMGLLSLEFP